MAQMQKKRQSWRQGRKILFTIGTALVLSSASPAFSGTWKCECGCGDPTCINIAGECYNQNRHHSFYELGEDRYLDVENENGTILHTPEGIKVDNIKRNHSWGYFFEIPGSARHYLHWTGTLDVETIEGAAWAGFTMENDSIGITFRVNRHGRSELVVSKTDIETHTVETIELPDELKDAVSSPFTIELDYDISQSVLEIRLNDVKVKTIHLPYNGIPAIASVSGFSMQTSNDEHTTIGNVTYGTLVVTGENKPSL